MSEPLKLTPMEQAYVDEAYSRERCSACGHLELFHNDHCCSFCCVTGCPCDFMKVPDDWTPEPTPAPPRVDGNET